MMTQMKERAVELIERIPDEKMFYVINILQDVYKRQDHYICGNTFRSVWALREYPTATDEQAILRHLGEMCIRDSV